MNSLPLYERLESKRKALNLSYNKVGELLGVHTTTISRVLRGITKNRELLKNIQDLFKRSEANPKTIILSKTERKSQKTKKQNKHKKKEVIKMMLPNSLLNKFKLEKDPFEDGDISKKEIWKSQNFKTAQGMIIEACRKNNFLLIYGESGTGKSVLIQEALSKLKSPRNIIVYFSPLFIEDFSSSYIAQEIIETVTGKRPPATHRQTAQELAKAVMKAQKEKKNITLILDEVHQLKHKILKALKRFHEGLGVHSSKLGIILVGQPEIVSDLQSMNLREVRRRLSFFQLDPFNAEHAIQIDTVKEYIKHKLECAGGNIDIFTDEALIEIAKRCDTPQEVNELCSYALYQAFLTDESKVIEDIINDI
jgi:type II secretory pathway predicted ATPase ExeA